MSDLPRAQNLPAPAPPRTSRVLLLGALLGLVVGTVLANLATALVELDESGTPGATCQHAEASIVGAPGGLLVGLAAAVAFLVLRRWRRGMALSVLGGGAAAVVALLLVTFLLHPLATNYLPVFVCGY